MLEFDIRLVLSTPTFPKILLPEDWSRLRQRTWAAFARTVGASLSQFMSIPRYQGLCICGWGNAMQYFTVTDPSSAIKTFLLEDPLIWLRRNCRWRGRFRVLPFPSSSRVLCPGLTLLRCYRGFQEVWWLSRSVYYKQMKDLQLYLLCMSITAL